MSRRRHVPPQSPGPVSDTPEVPYLIQPKVDYAFKKIFGQPENRDILAAFLNAVLFLTGPQRFSPEGLELLNPIRDRNHASDKYCVLDIHARSDSGVRVHIEIQLINLEDMHIRPLYYWARIFSSLLSRGQEYLSLEKTISINILDFDLLRGLDRYHSVFHLWEDEQRYKLNDLAEFHYFELPKLQVADVPIDAPEVKWLLYLTGVSDELFQLLAKDEPMLQKARTVQELLSQDKYERAAYEDRLKAIFDEEARSGRLRRYEEQLRQETEARRQAEARQQQAEARQQQAEARQQQAEARQQQAEESLRAAHQDQVSLLKSTAGGMLEARFGNDAQPLVPLLDRINTLESLQRLLPQLVRASSSEAVRELLNAALQLELS